MYWYYKYAFIGIAVIAGLALVISLRSYLPEFPRHDAADPGDGPGSASVSGGIPAPAAGNPGAMAPRGADLPRSGYTGDSRPAGGAAPAPDPADAAVYSKLGIARRHLDDKKYILARQVLDSVLADPQVTRYSKVWVDAADLLSEVNAVLLFTTVPCPEKQPYTVVKGDSVWKISRQLNVTMPMIMQWNGLDPTDPKVIIGQQLMVYKADWRIRVTKGQYLLELLDGDKLTMLYHIGIGKEGRTPPGTFKIATKERNPVWTHLGKRYEFGHPENVLGTRWMGLEPTGETSALLEGYGIHGTKDPDSIGQAESNGCVRMVNSDVEKLFDLVPYFTPVEILE